MCVHSFIHSCWPWESNHGMSQPSAHSNISWGPCHITGNFHEPVALIGRVALSCTTQAAFWGEAWWRVQELRPSELPGDSHRKPVEFGGGHPRSTETVFSRSLPPSLAESPCMVVVSDEELPAACVVAPQWQVWSGYKALGHFLACTMNLLPHVWEGPESTCIRLGHPMVIFSGPTWTKHTLLHNVHCLFWNPSCVCITL